MRYILFLLITLSTAVKAQVRPLIFVGSQGGNLSPVVNAGADQSITLPTNSVFFTGTATDPDGTITAYSWAKVSGGAYTITSATSASTTVTGLVAGTYVFRLTVTDNNGATSFDNVQVIVNAEVSNSSPTANAGVDQSITLPTSSISLSGSGVDTDGTIASYLWTRISGGAATITSASSASTTVTGLVEGSYVFRLTVTDNLGATGFDEMNVTVNPAPSGADTTYSDTTQYNINYAAQSISGWADLTPANTSPHTAIKTATVSGRTLSTNAGAAWLGVPATTSDTNGEDADDGGGFAHNSTAQRSYAFNYNNTYNGSTSDANLKVSGLNSGDWYVVEILPSRDAAVGAARYGKYIIIDADGQRETTTFSNGATINATGNTSKVVKLYGRANSSGEIFVFGSGTTNADETTRYAFFNTVRIYKMTITP